MWSFQGVCWGATASCLGQRTSRVQASPQGCWDGSCFSLLTPVSLLPLCLWSALSSFTLLFCPVTSSSARVQVFPCFCCLSPPLSASCTVCPGFLPSFLLLAPPSPCIHGANLLLTWRWNIHPATLPNPAAIQLEWQGGEREGFLNNFWTTWTSMVRRSTTGDNHKEDSVFHSSVARGGSAVSTACAAMHYISDPSHSPSEPFWAVMAMCRCSPNQVTSLACFHNGWQWVWLFKLAVAVPTIITALPPLAMVLVLRACQSRLAKWPHMEESISQLS